MFIYRSTLKGLYCLLSYNSLHSEDLRQGWEFWVDVCYKLKSFFTGKQLLKQRSNSEISHAEQVLWWLELRNSKILLHIEITYTTGEKCSLIKTSIRGCACFSTVEAVIKPGSQKRKQNFSLLYPNSYLILWEKESKRRSISHAFRERISHINHKWLDILH